MEFRERYFYFGYYPGTIRDLLQLVCGPLKADPGCTGIFFLDYYDYLPPESNPGDLKIFRAGRGEFKLPFYQIKDNHYECKTIRENKQSK